MQFKLVIMQRNGVSDEMPLEASRISIGREQGCDIVLRDPSVSRQHARLLRVLDHYYLEDLNSTNGTQLNQKNVSKHLLKDGDQLKIGSFDMRFEAERSQPVVAPQAPLREEPSPAPSGEQQKHERDTLSPRAQNLAKSAKLRFFRGPNAGQTEILQRALYTIGQPGGEVAAIARRPQGFFLLHIGGDRYPMINNKPVDSVAGVKLNEGDVVEVGENLAEISFP
ncbi:MAG: FHA domain-containing protein [Gammaproteobacteria bacterium]|nr:FHA domain-containing protein [Gammaproteobacteria bacterium]